MFQQRLQFVNTFQWICTLSTNSIIIHCILYCHLIEIDDQRRFIQQILNEIKFLIERRVQREDSFGIVDYKLRCRCNNVIIRMEK